jgi:hypothetical protein
MSAPWTFNPSLMYEHFVHVDDICCTQCLAYRVYTPNFNCRRHPCMVLGLGLGLSWYERIGLNGVSLITYGSIVQIQTRKQVQFS